MDNDVDKQSADDALEPNNTYNEPSVEKLPGEDEPPSSPPDDTHSLASIDEPSSDDGVDSDELYQEGIGGTTNADDQEIDSEDRPRPLEPKE